MSTLEEIKSLWTRSFSENGPITLCFFGDSVTLGCFEYKALISMNDSYPTNTLLKLREKYPHQVFNLINAGVGGNTTTNALNRVERDVINHHPDICFVAFGANDIWEEEGANFKENLKKIIDILQANQIKVVLLTQHHMNKKVMEDTHPELIEVAQKMANYQNSGKMEAIYNGTRALAKEYDLPLVDIYQEYTKFEENGIDTDTLLSNRINHPTKEMYKFYAQKIVEVLS